MDEICIGCRQEKFKNLFVIHYMDANNPTGEWFSNFGKMSPIELRIELRGYIVIQSILFLIVSIMVENPTEI